MENIIYRSILNTIKHSLDNKEEVYDNEIEDWLCLFCEQNPGIITIPEASELPNYEYYDELNKLDDYLSKHGIINYYDKKVDRYVYKYKED